MQTRRMKKWILAAAPTLTGWKRNGVESERAIGRTIDIDEARLAKAWRDRNSRRIKREEADRD